MICIQYNIQLFQTEFWGETTMAYNGHRRKELRTQEDWVPKLSFGKEISEVPAQVLRQCNMPASKDPTSSEI